MGAVYKKELRSFFKSPLAYVLIGLYTLVMGALFYFGNLTAGDPRIISNYGATMQIGAFLLIFFIPVITMKLLAEERKNKSEVLLLTSPTTVTSIVVGKYLAAATVFLVMLLTTIIFPVILTGLAEDPSLLPLSIYVGNYIGIFLLGLLFLSVGLLTSSFSDSQVLAVVNGIVSLLMLSFIGAIGQVAGGFIGKIATWISPLFRYQYFAVGLLSISDIVFYLSFTAVILFVTIINTERRRWSQG